MTFPTNTFAAVALAAVLCSCGAAAVPNAHIASATGAVRAAEEAGANNVPSAALELRLAKEQMAMAQHMIAQGQNERAEMVLRRAEADAELARACAREDTARTEARASQAQLSTLQAQGAAQ